MTQTESLTEHSRVPVGHDVAELEDALPGNVIEEDDVDGALAGVVVDHAREGHAAKVAGEHDPLPDTYVNH